MQGLESTTEPHMQIMADTWCCFGCLLIWHNSRRGARRSSHRLTNNASFSVESVEGTYSEVHSEQGRRRAVALAHAIHDWG